MIEIDSVVVASWFLSSFTELMFLEEEEVDKMMEQKMKEEEERKRTKEIEERMSLEETKEQVWKAFLKETQVSYLYCNQSLLCLRRVRSVTPIYASGNENGGETAGTPRGETPALLTA